MSIPTGPKFVAAGTLTSAASVTTRTPAMPILSNGHGIALAVIAIKSNAVISTVTPGWTLLYQDNSGASFTQAVFIARGDAVAPVLSWSGAVNAAAYTQFYDDPENPISITTGATSVGSGTGTALSTASITTTNVNGVVVAISAINIVAVLNAVGLYDTDTVFSSGAPGIAGYAGSRFIAATGVATGVFNQTSTVSGTWVVRHIELMSVVNPTGLWTIETEFATASQVGDGLRADAVELATLMQVGDGARFSEIELASVSRVGSGIRFAEIEFAAVLIPGIEPPPPSPAPQISKVRTWGFSLDGHDFYCLRLGNDETLVFDITTGENVPWDSFGRNVWKAHQGLNWLGVGREIYQNGVLTNVIAGDDSLGVLWALDPAYGVDDPADGAVTEPFTRVITAGVPLRERQATSCDAVFVTAANGMPFTGQESILLRTSDDNGKTWQSQGSVALIAGDFSQEISWRSLGKVAAPGRIFELTDTGATVRIDSVDVLFKGR